MLSASSSSSFSAASMSCSMWALTSAGMFRDSSTLSSRSNTLTAYQRCCSSGRVCTAASSMWAMACSTGPENLCIGMVLPLFAALMAVSAASLTPSPFSAETSTTGQPSSTGQLRNVDLVAVLADDVHHVHRQHHGDAKLGELRGEIKVTLKVRAVDDVQNGVGARRR